MCSYFVDFRSPVCESVTFSNTSNISQAAVELSKLSYTWYRDIGATPELLNWIFRYFQSSRVSALFFSPKIAGIGVIFVLIVPGIISIYQQQPSIGIIDY